MSSIKDVLYINSLLDIYGDLLTANQIKIMKMYYEFNLSFGEIADELSISRAAVNDTIKKSINLLNKYENCLNLLQKRNKLHELCDKIDGNDNVKKEIKEVL